MLSLVNNWGINRDRITDRTILAFTDPELSTIEWWNSGTLSLGRKPQYTAPSYNMQH